MKNHRFLLIAHSLDVAFHRAWIRRLGLIAVVCWALLATVGFVALVQQQLENHQAAQKSEIAEQVSKALHGTEIHNCGQIEQIKDVIRKVIAQSAQQLSRPGSAGYDYYRAHPLELAAAKAATQAEERRFAKSSCS